MADNRKLSALPAAQTLGSGDLMYVVREGLSSRASLGQFVTFAAATMQPAAANLTALSGLEAIAGRLPYFTGTGAMATAPTSAYGRSLLNLADAAAGRIALGAAVQADAQALADGLALKADAAVSIAGAGLVTGGGALSASRTLTVAEASEAEALAGTAADKAMTPRRTRTVVDAAVDGLADAIDTLTAGQTASAVVAATWSDLSGYDTGARSAGDYGKVVGSDSGTHTDPAAGGTVDNRGIYAWSETPAGWRRVADLDADAAAASAAAAEAAVEALLPPADYGNAGGTGDRTSTIIVTTSDGLINSVLGETPSNLVDGVVANGSSAAISFTPGLAAGSYIRFDFGPGAAQRITEARWVQGNADGHGMWKWRASNDLIAYDDIGSNFMLGGVTSQIQTELVNNTGGYRYYELIGVSGTRSINPYLQEIEFKIAPTSFDERLLVPTHGAAGEVLTKWSNASGDYGFHPARRVYPMPTTEMLAEWYFDEGKGERVRDIRGGDGTRDIVFDSTFRTNYASSPEWTRKGLLLQDDMVQTASALPGARTVATLYRIAHGGTGVILSGGASSGHGVLGQDVSKTYSHWVANGAGIAPLLFDPANGSAAFRLNRGGWLLIFTEFDAPYNTKLGWGGVHSSTSVRAAELEVAWSACWSGQLNGEDRETVFLGVRRLAAERDIYLHWRDCPDFIDGVLFWGQSGITGYSLIGDLSAEDQIRTQLADSVLISHATGSSGEWIMPEPFQFRYNHRAQGLLDSRMGPLPGAAWAHEDNRSTRRRKLLVNQSAQDSTSLAVAGQAGPYEPSRTWNVAYLAPSSGMLAGAMRHWWQIEQYFLLQGIGPRPRALWYFQGEEDSIDTVQSAEYGANLAALWDAAKTYLATPTDFTMKLVKTPVLTSLAGFETLANNEVRAAQVAFASAEPDVTLISGDDLPQQNVGWPLDEHFTGQGIKTLGERLYAATNLA